MHCIVLSPKTLEYLQKRGNIWTCSVDNQRVELNTVFDSIRYCELIIKKSLRNRWNFTLINPTDGENYLNVYNLSKCYYQKILNQAISLLNGEVNSPITPAIGIEFKGKALTFLETPWTYQNVSIERQSDEIRIKFNDKIIKGRIWSNICVPQEMLEATLMFAKDLKTYKFNEEL